MSDSPSRVVLRGLPCVYADETYTMGMARMTSATGRLSLRIADPGQEQVLRHAAQLRGSTLTEFVLGAALQAATETIELHERLELRAATFDAFVRALDTEPPRDLPVLRRYAHPA